MLIATSYGLGTVAQAQAQAVVYPDIVRGVPDIPIEKLIAIGAAIGHSDPEGPANQMRTRREPLGWGRRRARL